MNDVAWMNDVTMMNEKSLFSSFKSTWFFARLGKPKTLSRGIVHFIPETEDMTKNLLQGLSFEKKKMHQLDDIDDVALFFHNCS